MQKETGPTEEKPLGAEPKERKTAKLYLYVVVISLIIFFVWLFLLPYTLKLKKDYAAQEEDMQKINTEASSILEEVKNALHNLNEKLDSLKSGTSTESYPNGTSTDESAQIIREKLFEITATEK